MVQPRHMLARSYRTSAARLITLVDVKVHNYDKLLCARICAEYMGEESGPRA